MDHWLKFLSDDESHLQKQKSEQQHNHQHLFDSRYPIKSKDRDNLHSHRKADVYNDPMQLGSVRDSRLTGVYRGSSGHDQSFTTNQLTPDLKQCSKVKR